MATAVRRPVPQPTTEVVLTLSEREAEVLLRVTYAIGGDPCITARKHTDAIGSALSRAGVKAGELQNVTIGAIRLGDIPA